MLTGRSGSTVLLAPEQRLDVPGGHDVEGDAKVGAVGAQTEGEVLAHAVTGEVDVAVADSSARTETPTHLPSSAHRCGAGSVAPERP